MMKKQVLDRITSLPVTVIVLVGIFLLLDGRLNSTGIGSASSSAQEPVQNTLLPRFINFDIGASTLRSGAQFQEAALLPDLPPYVELPNADYPLMMVNFTMPPDYASGEDVMVRLVWSPDDTNCFYVLSSELVGYGPGDNVALFDPYWGDETVSSLDENLEIGSVKQTDELFITFKAVDGYAAEDGDAMTFTLWRHAEEVNDTCSNEILIRSISVVYQGHTTYLPWTP